VLSALVQNTVLFTPITTVTVSGVKPGGELAAPLTVVTFTQAAEGHVTVAWLELEVVVDLSWLGAMANW